MIKDISRTVVYHDRCHGHTGGGHGGGVLLEEGERQEEAVPGVEGGGGAQAGRSLPPVPAAGGRQHCLGESAP